MGVEWGSWGIALGGTVNTAVEAWPECDFEKRTEEVERLSGSVVLKQMVHQNHP